MRLFSLDTALWAAGPLLNAAFLFILIGRGRLRAFRLLALWCLYTILAAIALLLINQHCSDRTYAVAYWINETLDACLQVGVVAEVAWFVFQPLRGWIYRRRLRLFLSSTLAAIALSVLVAQVHPPALTTAGTWEIRGELLTSVLIACMFSVVIYGSQKLGLHWRSHVMSIGYGLMVWAVLTVAIDLLHGYLGTSSHYLTLEYLRMGVYLGILVYWCAALWRNEPEKSALTPEMRDTLLHLTDKVSYDLAKALGTRGKEVR